ncbi:FCS-Like Zinc finger 10-like [Abrus precatorius]|uniref:FCS-Like Zinc finger 10-like n=1 Tax=Abrus precatorius TaxID=3816 RepID=A0A8B8KEP9_ABRPR|nr:FCS-Like Zinc finger 10-like [Abrus precatorius]XP_027342232.1 FCS-Like Zinc finger 10-like [Abrus precatorius]
MADSSSNFSLPCDALSLRQISFSIFHSSGSRLGVGAKGLSDSESVWSPTSPLDCRLFSNLSNPFSVKSSRPSFKTGHKKQFDCSKVGLGIVSSLVNETKFNNDIFGKFQRKNIIFGPQVKTGILKFSDSNHESLTSYLKSNSLPKNYVISLPSETRSPKSEVENFDDVSGKREGNWEPETSKSTMTSLPDSIRPSSLINSNQNSILGTNDLFVQNTSTLMNLPPMTSRSSQVDYVLKVKSNSLPISIDFSKGYIGSLSAREIELSEDYTCIISHGPNPKRTHIFGDCILECHNNDFTEFSKKEEPAFGSSHVPSSSEGSAPYPSGNVLSFCYSCNKKLEKGEDIYRYSDEKAFCSFNCRSEEISVEELERTSTNSAESSPNSSYHDLFLTGLLVSK